MSQTGVVGDLPSHKIARRRYCCLILNQMREDVSKILC